MVCRYAVLAVALTLGCFVVESRAQEKATSEAAKPAPAGTNTKAATPDAEKPAATAATGQSAKSTRSPADKKTTASASANTRTKPKTERATFGAGCFWHVEAEFERLNGVNWAVSGYAGGNIPRPSYEMVHEGFTGHAEVVMVDYDPEVISYEDLLKVFWRIHDPTTINRQGPDEGPQYRSMILYHNEDQRRAALASYRALTEMRAYPSPIVTQLDPMKAFYRAEEYHQDYYGGKPRATTTRRRRTSLAKTKKAHAKAGHAAVPPKQTSSDSKEGSAKPQS